MIKNINNNMKGTDVSQSTKDKSIWKAMIVHALIEYDTLKNMQTTKTKKKKKKKGSIIRPSSERN